MGATEGYNSEDFFGDISHLTHAYQNWTHLDEIGMVVELPPNAPGIALPHVRRAYMDQWIRQQGGLGTWNASTGSITLSGGNDPRYRGTYDYVGHYAGKPVYRRGNVVIAYVDAWQVYDLDAGGSVYVGSGAVAYPSQVDWWTTSYGGSNPQANPPILTRGWGGTAAIPRWPKYDHPPGPSPIEASWTQRDYVYVPGNSVPPPPPASGTASLWEVPTVIHPNMLATPIGGTELQTYIENGENPAMTIIDLTDDGTGKVGQDGSGREIEFYGGPTSSGGVSMETPPASIPVDTYTAPSEVPAILQDVNNQLRETVGGTILGIEPVYALGAVAAIVALFMFSKK